MSYIASINVLSDIVLNSARAFIVVRLMFSAVESREAGSRRGSYEDTRVKPGQELSDTLLSGTP